MATKKRGLGLGLDNLIPTMGLDMIEEEMKKENVSWSLIYFVSSCFAIVTVDCLLKTSRAGWMKPLEFFLFCFVIFCHVILRLHLRIWKLLR